MKKKKSISERPSTKEISDLRPIAKKIKDEPGFLKTLGVSGDALEQINKAATAALSHSDDLTLPDRFNEAFADMGWIATGSMSPDTMRDALDKAESDDPEGAEEIIMDWFTADRIRLFAIKPSKNFSVASDRWHQLNEALELTEEEKYYSAVPLILIICDGFASDVMGHSPFEKDADLTLFDSIVGHETSLPSLIRLITKGVRKSSNDSVEIPYRHGILHGRTLGYANRKVCLKAWMLMIALVDWARDKRDEPARKAKHEANENQTLSSTLAEYIKLQEDKAVMEAFKRKRWSPPFKPEAEPDGPVFAFFDFLDSWKSKNYGAMAKRAVNLEHLKHGSLAGKLRDDGGMIELLDFKITEVKQSLITKANAIVEMTGKSSKGKVVGTFSVLAFRYKDGGDIAMPSDERSWRVQENCMFALMNKSTIDKK